MATAKEPKKNLGKIDCINRKCSDRVAVYVNASGTISVSCQNCDMSAFAKKGTEAARGWLSEIPLPASPLPPLEASPKEPEQATAPKKSGFAFGGL